MSMYFIIYAVVFYAIRRANAIPPSACFAPFRSDDCGKNPVPVMYYWKPGSRCELGYWRGCLPNLNMFEDEYQCISTCIFSARSKDEDYHKFNEIGNEDQKSGEDTTTDLATADANSTDIASTNDVNASTNDIGGGSDVTTDENGTQTAGGESATTLDPGATLDTGATATGTNDPATTAT